MANYHVKIFWGKQIADIEQDINDWLDAKAGTIEIRNVDTTTVNDSRITVTVFYIEV